MLKPRKKDLSLELSARVTLARGLPNLPCKRSARDNSPNRFNFPSLCVTSNRANLKGIGGYRCLVGGEFPLFELMNCLFL